MKNNIKDLDERLDKGLDIFKYLWILVVLVFPLILATIIYQYFLTLWHLYLERELRQKKAVFSKLPKAWEFTLSQSAWVLGFINAAIYFFKGVTLYPDGSMGFNIFTLLLIVQIIVGITVSGMENILKKKQEKA